MGTLCGRFLIQLESDSGSIENSLKGGMHPHGCLGNSGQDTSLSPLKREPNLHLLQTNNTPNLMKGKNPKV